MRIQGTGVRWWRAAGVAVTSCALLAGTAVPGSPAYAQTAPDPCPEPFPTDELDVGMVAAGLTVERGTTPDGFTATILGVLDDGIAPGLDMIIAETSSPAIERAGGIWAGMSGSPVYAPDGRLIGAVAYGFSTAPSPIAGITPAADMYQVLSRPSTVGTEGEELVRLPAALRSRVVGTGEVTAAEAAAGMTRLPVPVVVSGLSAGRLDEVSERLGDRLGNIRLVSGSAAPGAASTPADIFPGGNFAATQSYGDLTFGGIGTTTAVCDDRALAFGHPFGFVGASTYGAHPADAVFVQRDNSFGSFKVANIQGVVGTVDQDRLAAIRAVLGTGPATVPVRSLAASLPDGADREGLTQIADQPFVPDIAALAHLANLDRVIDRVGGGSAAVRWTVEGRRASGAPFELDVSNMYASQSDISFEAILDSLDQLLAIQNNPFEAATITGVEYRTVVDTFQRYAITTVQVRQPDGTYQPVPTDEPLQVAAGSRLQLRVTLTPYQDRDQEPAVDVDLSVLVPHGTVGASGSLDVVGGRTLEEAEPENFDQLLTQLDRLVPNNAVTASLSIFEGEDPTQTQGRALADQVVVGEQSFEVEVVSAPRVRPAVIDGGTWRLRSALSSGNPTQTFSFGDSSYQQLMCDWNGDGRTEPALFRDGTWQVRSSLTGSARTVNFGLAGDRPLCGDWNGDGREEIGVWRNGRWLLRTGVDSGDIGWDFTFGPASGWKPIVGDWNGDAIDTVGVVRRGEWQVRNSLSTGTATYTFSFGQPGDIALVGDWNRDGRDTIGIYRDGTWRIRNALLSGSATAFQYGGADSRPVVWQ